MFSNKIKLLLSNYLEIYKPFGKYNFCLSQNQTFFFEPVVVFGLDERVCKRSTKVECFEIGCNDVVERTPNGRLRSDCTPTLEFCCRFSGTGGGGYVISLYIFTSLIVFWNWRDVVCESSRSRSRSIISCSICCCFSRRRSYSEMRNNLKYKVKHDYNHVNIEMFLFF